MNLDSVGFFGLLFFGLLAAGANVLGGFVLISAGAHRFGERLLKYLVALGAGFMLAAIFIEIIPETFIIWTSNLEGQAAAEAVIGAMTLPDLSVPVTTWKVCLSVSSPFGSFQVPPTFAGTIQR